MRREKAQLTDAIAEARLALQQAHLEREFVRQPAIIVIQEGHIGLARQGEPLVARSGQARSLLIHHPDPRKGFGHSNGAVTGITVHHQNLSRWQSLCTDAAQRLGQIVRPIANRHDHTHSGGATIWRRHAPASSGGALGHPCSSTSWIGSSMSRSDMFVCVVSTGGVNVLPVRSAG